jgi:hypothetical protein
MPDRSGVFPQDNRAWMLAIGRRLRAEYDAVAEPVPERLAALIKELQAPVRGRVVEIAPSPLASAPSPPRLDPDGHGSSPNRPTTLPNSAVCPSDQGVKRNFG